MADIDKWAASQPDEYLECRDTGIGHNWTPKTAYRDGREIVEVIWCPRCTAEKTRVIDGKGRRKGNRGSSYPEGYVRKGLGRVTKDENASVRLAALGRRYNLDDLAEAPEDLRRKRRKR